MVQHVSPANTPIKTGITNARPVAYSLRLVVRTILRAASNTWQLLGVSTLLFIVLNLVLWGLSRVTTTPARISSFERMATVSLDTADRGLVQRFAQEFLATTTNPQHMDLLQWEPYSLWRSRPFHGEFIRIGNNGLRRTISANATTPEMPRVYLYGGSVAWGMGARDEHTIASCLARLLYEARCPSEVVNCAQLGFVSTQERIAFEQTCAHGECPTVAIFLLGVNDIASTMQHDRAGLTINEANRQAEFNILNEGSTAELAAGMIRRLPFYRVLIDNGEHPAGRMTGTKYTGVDNLALEDPEFVRRLQESLVAQPLAKGETREMRILTLHRQDVCRAAVELLGRNCDMASSVARQFGGDALFFWQPTVFDRHAPSSGEREIQRQAFDFGQYYLLARTIMRDQQRDPDGTSSSETSNGIRRILDLSHTFDSANWDNKTEFFDFCHLTESANLVIARAILPHVLAALRMARSTPEL